MAEPPIPLDVFGGNPHLIHTVDMHTTGEPTRIIYSGYPSLQGSTLLEKRVDAKTNHDDIRSRLMLEPRGHKEMYGALVVNETEFTRSGDADIGVLFMHTAGWSTMCGHATIALGRFLVDFDKDVCLDVWPSRKLALDEREMTVSIKLHCPCGVVQVTVPVTKSSRGRLQSDPERKVSFVNVGCFASGIDIGIAIPPIYRWPELGNNTHVTVDFCYGGAFYCVVGVKELGFPKDLSDSSVDALSLATRLLKSAIIADVELHSLFEHPVEKELGFLYGVIVTDETGVIEEGTAGAETGLCIFAAQQIDRSPCGSGVSARTALAYEKGKRLLGQRWTYHSMLSNAHDGQGSFTTHIVGGAPGLANGISVQVEGRAFYTVFATYLVEETDNISRSGFSI